MAQAITSSLRNIAAERVCKIFGGHQMRKYGDGVFCRNCGKSEEDVKKEKEESNGRNG